MLGVDFDIEHPDEHPELVEEVRRLAARYDHASKA